MPLFRYELTDPKGRPVRGVISATSMVDARELLAVKGLHDMTLLQLLSTDTLEAEIRSKRETTLREPVGLSGILQRPAPPSDLALYFRQMGAYIHSGLSAAEALEEIGSRTRHRQLRIRSLRMAERVRNGSAIGLSARLERLPISAMQLGMMEIGERTGTLELALEEAALSAETDMALSKGMAWTKWLFWQNIWSLAFLAPVVRGIDIENIKNSLEVWGLDLIRISLPICLLIHIAHGIFIYFSMTPIGRSFTGRVALIFPASRQTAFRRAESTFLRALQQAIKAGLPADTAVTIASTAIGNGALTAATQKAAAQLSNGSNLATVTDSLVFLPHGVKARITTGERTGTLEKTLKQLADDAANSAINAVANDRAFRKWGSIGVTSVATIVVTLVLGIGMKDAMFTFLSTFTSGSE